MLGGRRRGGILGFGGVMEAVERAARAERGDVVGRARRREVR